MKADRMKADRPCIRVKGPGLACLPYFTFAVFAVSLSTYSQEASAEDTFLRGDVNTDGQVSISDMLTVRRYLFSGGMAPTCMDAADANDDGNVDLSDCFKILYRLFRNGPPMPGPYPEIGMDPTGDDLRCEQYELEAPKHTDDVIRLGEVLAGAGDEVLIPVFVTTTREIEAFQLVAQYDPALFTPSQIGWHNGLRQIIEGSVNEDLLAASYEGNPEVPANCQHGGLYEVATFPDGVFSMCFIPNLLCTGYEIPAGAELHAFNIVGRVSPHAPEGSVIPIEPTNGPDGAGIGPEKLRNEMTYRGGARLVTIIPQTLPGRIQIVPDIAIFIRGDANGDKTVNISDPQTTLGYLFLGNAEPPCLDAADANDDGELDITDPIATLQFLFLGGAPLPPPGEAAPGSDRTEDSLDCMTGLNHLQP